MSADEDFPLASQIRKWHHQKPSVPKAEDEVITFFPSVNDFFVVYLFDSEGNSQQIEKHKNQGGQNVDHEKSLDSFIHSLPVSLT